MILNFNNSLVITRTIQNMYIWHFTFLVVLYKVLHVCDVQRSFASFVSLMVSFSYYFCKPQLTWSIMLMQCEGHLWVSAEESGSYLVWKPNRCNIPRQRNVLQYCKLPENVLVGGCQNWAAKNFNVWIFWMCSVGTAEYSSDIRSF